MAVQGKTTAVAVRDLVKDPIVSIDQLRSMYEKIEKQANLISPIVSPDFIPPMSRVSMRVVVLDSAEAKGDVYTDAQFCRKDERAPTKIGLLKLLQGAGGSISETERLDDGRTPHLATYRVTIRLPQLDGTTSEYKATKTVDYRDGSGQIASFSEKQLKQSRRFVAELAETKALERTIRAGLALKQKYTVSELAKPFVLPALIVDVDAAIEDPEIRKEYARHKLGITTRLYGEEQKALPAASEEGAEVDVEREPDDFTEGAAPEPEPVKEAAGAVCACPCGCEASITQEVADKTIEKLGAARCVSCYPWRATFDFSKHKPSLDLELPLFAGWTSKRVRAWQKENLR